MTVVCPICGKENELRKYQFGPWNEICMGSGYLSGRVGRDLYKSTEKEVYWSAPLFGLREVPAEEFERWLKLRAFQ